MDVFKRQEETYVIWEEHPYTLIKDGIGTPMYVNETEQMNRIIQQTLL